MRKVCFILALFSVVSIKAQRIEIGGRDNQYAKISYVTSRNIYIGFEQSFLNVKPKEQSGTLLVGYRYKISNWHTDASVYLGSEYSRNWQKYGAFIKEQFSYKRIELIGTINPNYDNKLEFQFNYDLAALFTLFSKNNGEQSISIKTSFGTIPEYRDNKKNFRIGMRFFSKALWVQPEITVPGINEDNTHIRVLCNFGYSLDL